MIKNNKLPIILVLCLLITCITSHNVLGKNNDKNTEKNIKQEFIKDLHIQGDRQVQINELIKKGYSEKDVYIAYAFLCEKYGTLEELNNMLEQKTSKKSWQSIFQQYDKNHKKFQPRKFEPDYIDELIISEVSADDIMICDKIAYKSKKEYKDIMTEHMEGSSFIEIANRLGIICNEEKLLRIQVTEDELNKYIKKYKFTREQIFGYCVLAKKTSQNCYTVMNKISEGSNKYSVLADYYEGIFK
jgi:hypothetical protein